MFQYSWNETFWHYQNARRRFKWFIWIYSHKNVTEISTFSQHVLIWAKLHFSFPLENDFIKNKWPPLITTHWAFAPKVKAIKTALRLYLWGNRFSFTGCYEKSLSPLQKGWFLMSLRLQAFCVPPLTGICNLSKSFQEFNKQVKSKRQRAHSNPLKKIVIDFWV